MGCYVSSRGIMAGLNGRIYEWGQVKSCMTHRIMMNAPITLRLHEGIDMFNTG